MEAVVLHRVGFLAYFCRKQGQDFKPSAAPLYPNMGQVTPPLGGVCGFISLAFDFGRNTLTLCELIGYADLMHFCENLPEHFKDNDK